MTEDIGGQEEEQFLEEEQYGCDEEEQVVDEENADESKIFNYQMKQEIGQGAICRVYLVEDTNDGSLHAAKAYPYSQLNRVEFGQQSRMERLLAEISILAKCKHENLISIEEVIQDDVSNKVYLIIPFADKGTLSPECWRAKPLSEEEARPIFKQIANGLNYLHQKNIVHRDIKPDNILCFSDGRVVISDFSSSKCLNTPDELLDDTDGTPAFRAPEEESGDSYNGKIADVWSFGMTLYVLIFGLLPYKIDYNEGTYFSQCTQIAEQILTLDVPFERDPPISKELFDLFHRLLDKDPRSRITMSEALEMPWLNK